MAPDEPPTASTATTNLAASGVTMHSDSEQYASSPSGGPDDDDEESPSASSPDGGRDTLILYRPLTLWGLVRGAAINLLLPFVNGMMLGFGELFAHEAAWRLGWGGTKVFPTTRRRDHLIGPGIEVRERRPRPSPGLDDLTSLE